MPSEKNDGQETVVLKPIDMAVLATILRRSIYNAYVATMVGSPAQITKRYYERANKPQIGDLVTEITTIYRMRNNEVAGLDGIGILEEINLEKVVFSDPEFKWDEEIEGRPHPTETVYYIRTFDGRRFRWTNATFVSAVAAFPDAHGVGN